MNATITVTVGGTTAIRQRELTDAELASDDAKHRGLIGDASRAITSVLSNGNFVKPSNAKEGRYDVHPDGSVRATPKPLAPFKPYTTCEFSLRPSRQIQGTTHISWTDGKVVLSSGQFLVSKGVQFFCEPGSAVLFDVADRTFVALNTSAAERVLRYDTAAQARYLVVGTISNSGEELFRYGLGGSPPELLQGDR